MWSSEKDEKGEVPVKKIISFLVLLAVIPVAFMAGCGKSSNPTSNPDTPTPTNGILIATSTRTATSTATQTTTGTLVSNTSTYTSTATASSTVTNTITPAQPTSTSTSTQTVTNSQTNTVTNTVTNSQTNSSTSTATNTMTVTQTPQTAQVAVNLNSAASFAVLASTGITASGNPTICGNMGISPGSSVTGSVIYSCLGSLITGSIAGTGQTDLTTAYNDAAGRSNGAAISGDLGGLTIYPGLYNTASAIRITGDLTLDAQGNTSAIFIFQIGTTLTTATTGNITLANGANPANVFWQVGSSCSLGAGSTFSGTIMAHTLIAFGTGATLNGRALSETGEVTMLTNSVTNPTP